MDYNEKDIDTLLQRWHSTKSEISELESKLEKYKKFAEQIMSKENINKLSNDDYTLTRSEMNRSILAKDDVPKEIWYKYSKNITYNMFTIRKKTDKTVKTDKKYKKRSL